MLARDRREQAITSVSAAAAISPSTDIGFGGLAGHPRCRDPPPREAGNARGSTRHARRDLDCADSAAARRHRLTETAGIRAVAFAGTTSWAPEEAIMISRIVRCHQMPNPGGLVAEVERDEERRQCEEDDGIGGDGAPAGLRPKVS